MRTRAPACFFVEVSRALDPLVDRGRIPLGIDRVNDLCYTRVDVLRVVLLKCGWRKREGVLVHIVCGKQGVFCSVDYSPKRVSLTLSNRYC